MNIPELVVIAEIRAAAGVGDKPMLHELPEMINQLKHDADRFKLVQEWYARDGSMGGLSQIMDPDN